MQQLTRRRVLGIGIVAAGGPLVLAPRSLAQGGPPLAIRGYDAVAYFTLGKATPGRPDLEYEWDEHRYRFARPEHRDLFKADPVRYAPQFANYCAMGLTRAELDEGNPEYWMVSDGKLYLFGKPVGPDLFRRDLAGNLDKANDNAAWLLNR